MKHIIIVLTFLPVFVFSQIDDQKGIVFGLNYGFAQDISYTEEDINEFSPDMSSEILGSDRGYQISIGYKVNDITFGINFRNCNITGENTIEYHESKFRERNLFAEYDIVKKDSYILFLTGSFGSVNYDSKRYLIHDDTELPINSPSGDASKYNFGGGIKILLTDYLLLTASTTMDVVDDDGFDGWDYGTNIDKFSYHSVGLRILF